MKKAIILTSVSFPRSGAPSNYIQYLSQILMALGYQVSVYGQKNPEYAGQMPEGFYHGIAVKDIISPKYKLVYKVLNKLFFRQILLSKLKKLDLDQDDLIIDYSLNASIYEVMFALREKYGCKLVCCPTEWFAQENWSGDYAAYSYLFEELKPKCDLILPISKNIQRFYDSLGCLTYILPATIDSQEFVTVPKERGSYKIVIPANGMMKDALDTMAMAVYEVCAMDLPCEIHILGVSEAAFQTILGEERYARVSAKIVFHGWMKYPQLVELYQSCHYLLLAREESQMTISNFPSKVPECMAYGIVPVISDVGDITKAYLRKDYDSIYIDECTVNSCAAALQRAVSLPFDTYQQLSQNAKTTAEAVFDFRNWTRGVGYAIDKLYGKD